MADISRKLRHGECFVQVTVHQDEVSNYTAASSDGNNYRRVRSSHGLYKIPDGTPMVVVKCPTYYPGDMRILKQRHIPELEHLVDVVVFPVDGLDRPHPNEIHERSVPNLTSSLGPF